MIQALSLFFIPIGMFLVSQFEIFGFLGEVALATYAGGAIALFWGVILLIENFPIIKIRLENSYRGEIMVILSSITILGYLIFVSLNYGLSPTISWLIDDTLDIDILHGRYRDMLPLRAFIPSLAVGQAFFTLFILPYKRNCINVLVKSLTILTLIVVTAIMETRHIVLWLMIYAIAYYMPNLKLFTKIKLRSFIRYMFIFSIIFMFFTFVGNIRSGFADNPDYGVVFAMAFELNPVLWELPGIVIWGIIYLFSGLARGINNGSNIELIDIHVPEALFPGVLQFLPKALDLAIPVANDRFSVQAMSIDAFHTLCINYGFLLAVVFFSAQIIMFIYLAQKIKNGLYRGNKVSILIYALFLWLGVRLLLLPIGDYFFRFDAILEFLFIYLFLNVSGATVEMKPEKNIKI